MQINELPDIVLPVNYHNNAGLYKVHYLFIDSIDTLNVADNSATVSLLSGNSWKLIESLKTGFGLEIKRSQSDQGDSFVSTIKGHYPVKTKAATQAFDLLSRLPLIIKAEDNDGNLRLLGSTAEPAEFNNVDFKTLGFPGTREGLAWEITCVTRDVPPFL